MRMGLTAISATAILPLLAALALLAAACQAGAPPAPSPPPATLHPPPTATPTPLPTERPVEKTVQPVQATPAESQTTTRNGTAVHTKTRDGVTVHSTVDFIRVSPPADIQEFVNRADVIVIGRVAGREGPVEELGYGQDLNSLKWELENSLPIFGIEVNYYDIELEEILLDDGNVSENALLRADAVYDPLELEAGDRLLFAMWPNPDFKSYGASFPWALIFLDGDAPRDYDGWGLRYEGATDEASLVAAIKSALPRRTSVPESLWINPVEGEGQWDGAVGRRSVGDRQGMMRVNRPPMDAQNFVNRAEAIVVGNISEIGDTFILGPKDPDPEVLEELAEYDIRAPGLAVTDYAIEVEKVLLDDGEISPVSSFRLFGIHNPRRPQVGERFLFALNIDEELRSYWVCCDWNLIILDDGRPSYFDDGEITFDGVSDEASLIEALESALTTRVKTTCPKDWPNRPEFESIGREC